jgi:molecular chaperone DnaK (HSP70)
MKQIYIQVADAVKQLLESAGVDIALLDEVILVGGTALLPGLTNQLSTVLHDSTAVRTDIDPSQVLSRGAAVQAGLLVSLSPNEPLLPAFGDSSKALDAQVTTKVIGVAFPEDNNEVNNPSAFIQVIASETPLPARRTVSFVAQLKESDDPQNLGIEVWEAEETVKVDQIEEEADPDNEDEEEPENIEIRERMMQRQTHLGSLNLPVTGSRGGKKKKGPMQATIVLTLVVERDGSVEVTAHQKDSTEPPSVLRIEG